MSVESTRQSETNGTTPQFGTFMGVFTPSILTILGVIMYLRFGWMVGNVGLWKALLIVTMSTAITFVTALSVSAIATNMRVGAGGEYFLISRSLGLEIGGAIGVPLYLARTASVTLYAFGLAESLRFVWPAAPIQPVAAGIIIIITLVAARSAQLTLRIQIPLMIAVFLSIAVLMIGVARDPQPIVVDGLGEKAEGFWIVLAIFFPAVTGFTAGVGLSGDLKNPGKSIPIGSVAAVACGYVVYMGVAITLAYAAPAEELVANKMIWQRVAVASWLILPGMWGAILSSAIGSILAGPRVLQALARDRIAPRALGRVSPKTGQPMTAVWLTGAAALGIAMLGDLNSIAPVVTMFFLTFYATINFVAGLENLIADPAYRPRFRVPCLVSFAASAGAIAVMFLINHLACIVAIVAEIGVWFWLRRRALRITFGDMRSGLWLSLAKFCLSRMRRLPPNPRSWRPHMLVFAGDVRKRLELLRLVNWLNQKRGVLSVCQITEGDLENAPADREWEMESTDRFLVENGLTAFSEIHIAPSFENGVEMTTQAHGIAGLASNTVVFGWSTKAKRVASFLGIMRRLGRLDISTLICRVAPGGAAGLRKRIDVWWRGRENNGDMMLLLAYLLKQNPEWHRAQITVKSVVTSPDQVVPMRDSLLKMIEDARIRAEAQAFAIDEGQSARDIIHAESRDADVVFLGIREPAPGDEREYADRMRLLIEGLPTVVFVKNSSFLAGRLV